jgi:hypothetical protein
MMNDEMMAERPEGLFATVGVAWPEEVDLEEWLVDWFYRGDCDGEPYSVFARVLAKELLAEVRRGNIG